MPVSGGACSCRWHKPSRESLLSGEQAWTHVIWSSEASRVEPRHNCLFFIEHAGKRSPALFWTPVLQQNRCTPGSEEDFQQHETPWWKVSR